MKRNLSPPKRSAITRIELVVLLIVIFMMLALLFPLLSHLRESNRQPRYRAECINNMKNIAMSMTNMASTKGKYPPAQGMNEEGEIQYNWRIALLPYMEQQQMYEEIMNNLPWDSGHNRQFEDKMPSLFACPTSPDLRPRQTTYQVIVGPETPFEGNRRTSIDDFERGLSNTILLVETTQGVPWMSPLDLPYANLDHGVMPLNSELWAVGGGHMGGVAVAMADGSVRSLGFSQKLKDVAFLKTMALLKEPNVP